MSVVRKDSHSLYIVANGSILRPVASSHDHGNGLSVTGGPVLLAGKWRKVGDRPVTVTVGDKVPARMIGHSPYFAVGPADSEREVWTTHGQRAYWNSKTRTTVQNNSEDCWRINATYDPRIDGGHN